MRKVRIILVIETEGSLELLNDYLADRTGKPNVELDLIECGILAVDEGLVSAEAEEVQVV